jgi:hypothetical protein
MAGKAGGPREHDGGVDSFAPDMVVARSAAELQRAFMHADGSGGMPTAPGMLPQATPAALLQHLRRQYGGGAPRQMFGGAGGLPRSAVSHSMPGHGVALYEVRVLRMPLPCAVLRARRARGAAGPSVAPSGAHPVPLQDNLFNLSPSAPFLGDDLVTGLEAPDGLEPSTGEQLLSAQCTSRLLHGIEGPPPQPPGAHSRLHHTSVPPSRLPALLLENMHPCCAGYSCPALPCPLSCPPSC